MYFRWFAFAPVSLAFNLFVILTSPLWALWAAAFKLEKLPGIFALAHTHDDWIYGHVHWTDRENIPPTFWQRWKYATIWLCRNPGYGFDAKVLGFPGDQLAWERSEQRGVFDIGGPAYKYVVMRTPDGRRWFSYRRDFRLSSKRYAKLWIGWQYTTQAGHHIIKCTFNPFRTLS